ncbi:hypothetical protein KUH32_08520 [Thalassococcus sp. CAU 1522]|uniref:Lipoprotein n=1 Tax=Thalassococcus arenae TaxID=2851652 RepID=A0ABS6N727_9RHOB|nr:hypothetical protein [Thalassococcus arenae]MBV2359816.1 hypothetical protein [Thalassococcus arenae]
MLRVFAVLSLVLALANCTNATADLEGPTEPLGDFRLGHVGVVAPNLQKLLVSRDATQEEWIAAVGGALETRFERFEGDKFYHLGVSVEAYSLPPPVVPGKSALSLRVTVWDDAAQAKLNDESEVINVIRVFESRLTQTRETQMQALVDEAAKAVEDWLRERQAEQGWFGGVPADAPAAEPAAAPAAVAVEAPPAPDAVFSGE